MAKTIVVSDDVYELSEKVRLPGESFPDVIRRGLSRGVKLPCQIFAAAAQLGKADWIRARETILESEEITRRKLDKMFHWIEMRLFDTTGS